MDREDRAAEAAPAAMERRGALRRWARLCCGGAFVALLLGEGVGGVWPVVLLTPYTPQAAVVGLIGVGMLAIATGRNRPTRMTAAFLTAGLLAVLWGGAITLGLVPWRTIPPAPRVAIADANLGRVKVMTANVHTENADHKTILKVIAEEDPDVVVLPEISDRWAADLRSLNDKYPVHTEMPDSLGNFGMAFYSRLPGTAEWITAIDAGPDDAYAVPQLSARLRLVDPAGGEHDLLMFGLHPLPPIKPGNTRARDAVLTKIGGLARVSGPSIVTGDLNATRYCRVMRQMTEYAELAGGLFDAASPLRFSWPNTWSWWATGIRIDHVLVSADWHVVDAHAGRDIGSDHLPIVATLQLVRERR